MKRKQKSSRPAAPFSYICEPFEGRCYPMENTEKKILDNWRTANRLPQSSSFGTYEECKSRCFGLPRAIKGEIHGYTGKDLLMSVSKGFSRFPPLDQKRLEELIVMNKPQILIGNLLKVLGYSEEEESKKSIGSILKEHPLSAQDIYSLLLTPFHEFVTSKNHKGFKRKLSLLYGDDDDRTAWTLANFFVFYLKQGKDQALAFLEFLRSDSDLKHKIRWVLEMVVNTKMSESKIADPYFHLDPFLRWTYFNFAVYPLDKYNGEPYIPSVKTLGNVIQNPDFDDYLLLRLLTISPEYSLSDLSALGNFLIDSPANVREIFSRFFVELHQWPSIDVTTNALWGPYLNWVMKRENKNEQPSWSDILIGDLKFMQKAYPDTWGKLKIRTLVADYGPDDEVPEVYSSDEN